MKTLKTLLFTSIFLISSNIYSQELRQFRNDEIISLFEKKQSDVYKILASKSYSYKGKDDVFDKFIKQTNFGDFIVNIVFKDGKIKGISTQEHNSIANLISIDFYKSNFKIRELSDINNAKKIEFEDRIIPFSGCFYLLNNLDKKITASFIISPYNPNVISLNYSRLTGKEYEKESKIVKEELKEIGNIDSHKDIKAETNEKSSEEVIIDEKIKLEEIEYERKLDSIIIPLRNRLNEISSKEIQNIATIEEKKEAEILEDKIINSYRLLQPEGTTRCRTYKATGLFSKPDIKSNKLFMIERGTIIFVYLNSFKEQPGKFVRCIFIDSKRTKHIGFILSSSLEWLQIG